jgi:predicted AAA+ superfamily ATPase
MQTLPSTISPNNTDTSIAPLLEKAKKYFAINSSKQYKNVVLDQGPILSFPAHTIQSQIPSGVYYVSSTRYDNFVLSKVSVTNNNTEVDEDFIDLMEAIGEDVSDLSTFESGYLRKLQKEHRTKYLGSNYFPTHDYNLTLNNIHSGIISFLNNKRFYQSNNLGFKRSILLYGSHGTGKSRYVEYIAKQLIDELDAIVIRVGSSQDVSLINDYGLITLNRVVKDRLIILIIEEMASIVCGRDGHIGLLNIMDNSLLRENLLILSTTNTPERIPENVLRNQRVDVLAEVTAEGYNDQFPVDFYKFIFGEEFPEKYRHSEWTQQKLNPADLKELFLYAKINDVDIDTSYEQLQSRNRIVKDRFQSRGHLGF